MTPEQREFGLLGLLVGDALGVPYEFTNMKDVPPLKDIQYEPPVGFKKAYNVPPGTWSDDGAQALCVLDALMTTGPNDSFVDAVGQRLLAWRTEGFMAVDGRVFDIGTTTNAALNRLASGVPTLEAGILGPNSKSNGSLMRTLPIAFLDATDDEIARAAMGQSKVTHAEIEPMVCCAFYAFWARHMAENALKARQSWQLACDTLYRVLPKSLMSYVALIEHWPGPAAGTGYCIDALHSAKYALQWSGDYESVVQMAVSLGQDTDTTAAIAGGLAGIKYRKIPQRWLDGLRGRDILDPVLQRLKNYDGRPSQPPTG